MDPYYQCIMFYIGSALSDLIYFSCRFFYRMFSYVNLHLLFSFNLSFYKFILFIYSFF